MGIAGIMDMTGYEKIMYNGYSLSRQHMFFDGIYTLILAIFVEKI